MTQQVRIHYLRPPDRADVYEQALVHRGDDALVTLVERSAIAEPVLVDGRAILDPGAPAVWFTFPGAHHDIGRFHLADGSFTGIYANILTPVRFIDDRTWETTDLFVDVWLAPGAAPRLLDEDELSAAVERGWVHRREAEAALQEARRLASAAAAGTWPPRVVHEWTLARARVAAGTTSSGAV